MLQHIFDLIKSPKSYHYIYKKAVQLYCIAFFIFESHILQAKTGELKYWLTCPLKPRIG